MIVVENEDGKPFADESDMLLRNTLRKYNIRISDCFITRTVKCYTLNDRIPTNREISCCFQYLEKEILEIKPKIIILVGSIACKAVLGQGAITKYRGYIIPSKKYNCYIAPIMHPTKVLDYRDFNIGQFQKDIENIANVLKKDIKIKSVEQEFLPLTNFDEIIFVLEDIISNKVAFSLDWETIGLKPFNKNSQIVSCGIATNIDSFSFLVENAWRGEKFNILKKQFQRLLTSDCIKIFHNYKFEKLWALERLNVNITGNIRDTQYISYILNPIKGTHSLDFLSFVHLGTPKMKEADKYKKDMSKCPKHILYKYNAMDARLTYDLHDILWPLLVGKDLGIYWELLIEGANATLKSEIEGALIDNDVRENLTQEMFKKNEENIKNINALPEVIKFREEKGKFDFKSTKDIRLLLFEYLKLKPFKETAKGFKSVDVKVLKYYGNIPFCKYLINYRDKATLIATYLEGMKKVTYDDGLIHTNYNVHTTETGRLSSTKPNLQNIPKRKNAFIRKMFIAPKDHYLMAFDFSGAELAAAAMYTKDKRLIKVIKEKHDMHQEWADILAKESKKEITRYQGKNGFIFPSIYGSWPKSIARNLEIPDRVALKVQKRFFSEFSRIKLWQNNLIDFYKENLYVESLLGRKRFAPLTINQIINMPLQSLASDFTLLSMIELSKRGYKIPLIIHDDLTFYIHGNDIEKAYKEIVEVMTCWDFSFINVPLRVDCNIGVNWYEMVPIKDIL